MNNTYFNSTEDNIEKVREAVHTIKLRILLGLLVIFGVSLFFGGIIAIISSSAIMGAF